MNDDTRPCPVRSCHYYVHACRNPAHRTWWRRLLLRLAGDR